MSANASYLTFIDKYFNIFLEDRFCKNGETLLGKPNTSNKSLVSLAVAAIAGAAAGAFVLGMVDEDPLSPSQLNLISEEAATRAAVHALCLERSSPCELRIVTQEGDEQREFRVSDGRVFEAGISGEATLPVSCTGDGSLGYPTGTCDVTALSLVTEQE